MARETTSGWSSSSAPTTRPTSSGSTRTSSPERPRAFTHSRLDGPIGCSLPDECEHAEAIALAIAADEVQASAGARSAADSLLHLWNGRSESDPRSPLQASPADECASEAQQRAHTGVAFPTYAESPEVVQPGIRALSVLPGFRARHEPRERFGRRRIRREKYFCNRGDDWWRRIPLGASLQAFHHAFDTAWCRHVQAVSPGSLAAR
jgi:hypothetical protein